MVTNIKIFIIELNISFIIHFLVFTEKYLSPFSIPVNNSLSKCAVKIYVEA